MRRRGVEAPLPYAVAGLYGVTLLADYDADDLLSTLADTDPVTTWTDRTGSSNDIGNTGSNRPTFDAANPHFNGHASVNFAKASTQYLFGSSLPICTTLGGTDTPWTAFIVARRTTKVTAQETYLSLGNSASAVNYQQCMCEYANSNSQRNSIGIRDAVAASQTTLRGTNELSDFSPQVLAFTRGAADGLIHVVGGTQNPLYDATVDSINSDSGTAYGDQGAFTFDRLAIGCLLRSTVSSASDLEVARVLIYSGELTEAERVRVASYLWFRYCVETDDVDLTGKLADGLVHSWNANNVTGFAGETVGSMIDSAGSKTMTAASGAKYPTIRLAENGSKYLEFDGTSDVMTAGAAADWKFLHDGSDFTLALVYRVAAADEALHPLVDTLDNDPVNNTGLSVLHDGASAAHSIQVKAGASHLTTALLNHDSQDYGARPDAWHALILVHQGTVPSSEENYHISLDNERYAQIDHGTGVTPDTGNPAGTLTLGALAGLGGYGKFDFRSLRLWNRALGQPSEVQQLAEVLAEYQGVSHVSLAAGNGLANVLNDTTKHRGFPALCQDANGTRHCIYRRAADHGSSRGVGVIVSSADGYRWSAERVIYDVDDADGRDFRGEGGFIRLTQGANAGRLVYFTKWSDDTSTIRVSGKPSTLLIGYSDDNGGTWTWLDPMENDSDKTNWSYTASPNGLIEQQTGANAGRIIITFSSNSTAWPNTLDQDIRLSYSDDGGLTWADSTIIVEHDVEPAANVRITETSLVEWDDGDLSLFMRDDTNKYIWRGTANVSDLTTWAVDASQLFSGWGRPVVVRDPNAAAGLFMFYRSTPGDITVWRYSSDEGATWGAERAFSNLHATTTVAQYNETSYVFATTDSAGNVWVAYGLEQGDDSDIFVRLWELAE